MKTLSFSPRKYLKPMSLYSTCTCVGRKARGSSLNCYKHCGSFPISHWVSYHLEAVVVVLMDGLLIPTSKKLDFHGNTRFCHQSVIQPKMPQTIVQACLATVDGVLPWYGYFLLGKRVVNAICYFSQPWYPCRLQIDSKGYYLLIWTEKNNNKNLGVTGGVGLEKDDQVLLWGSFGPGKSLADCFRTSLQWSNLLPV